MTLPKPDFRLSSRGLVNRNRAFSFWFQDRHYTGYQGDTVASALLAHGVHHVGQGARSGRPLGIWGLDADDLGARVAIGDPGPVDPRALATQQEVYESLAVHAGQAPSVARRWGDRLIRNVPTELAAHLPCPAPLTALPTAARAAIGAAVGARTCCDLLIVGAGPTGLWAARLAAEAGLDVLLVDRDHQLGGRALCETDAIGDLPGPFWVRKVLSDLVDMPNIRMLSRTTFVSQPEAGQAILQERVVGGEPDRDEDLPRTRIWDVQARHILLATGAAERGILFPGNDRPGIMSSAAMRGYLNRYGVAPGRAVSVFCNNDDGHRTAFDLFDAGIEIAAVIDARPGVLLKAPFPVLSGAEVVATEGGKRLNALTLRRREGTRRIETDALAVAGGWLPRFGPFWTMSPRPIWDDTALTHHAPKAGWPGVQVAGSAKGSASTAACLADAEAAIAEVVAASGAKLPMLDRPAAQSQTADAAAFWAVDAPGHILVDRAADVTLEELKTDPDRFARLCAAECLASLPFQVDGPSRGAEITLTGLRLSDLAALHARPSPRQSPALNAAKSRGGRASDVAGWAVISSFGDVAAEVGMLTGAVGIADLSHYPRLELQGPDLEGFCRDALVVAPPKPGHMMATPAGTGDLARLTVDRLRVLSAPGGGSGARLELGSAQGRAVALTDLTDGTVLFALIGPRAHELLRWLLAADRDPAAMPDNMLWPVELHDLPGWVFRPAGSRPYFLLEAPARFGDALWRDLLARAEGLAGGAVGAEALDQLRVMDGVPGPTERAATGDLVRIDAPAGLPVAPGAGLFAEGAERCPENALGYVTSVSGSDGQPVMALARVHPGQASAGAVLTLIDPMTGAEGRVTLHPLPATEARDA